MAEPMHGAGDSALSRVKILTDLETGRNPHCSLDPWNTSCYDRKGRGIVLGLVIMSTDNNPTVTARPRGKGRDWFHCQSFKDAGGTAYHVRFNNPAIFSFMVYAFGAISKSLLPKSMLHRFFFLL